MRMKIGTVMKSLDEAQNECLKCKYYTYIYLFLIDKKLLEEINNNRMKP
jgi:hypothetical protein